MNASRRPVFAGSDGSGYQCVDHGDVAEALASVGPPGLWLPLGWPLDLSYVCASSKTRRRTMPDPKPLTIKVLADHLKTDARTLRAFLRDNELGVGRGKRYVWPSINDVAVKRIIKAYGAAQDAHARADRDAHATDTPNRQDAQKAAA